MKVVNLDPIKSKHANSVLRGFGDVVDLPITRVEFADKTEAVVSVWSASIWTRIRFLFCGEVNLVVRGLTHPPVSICLGDWRKNLL